MFEISQEDRDVMTMCHENRRRSEMTTTIGYIVPKEQAERIAYEAAQKEHGRDWVGPVMMILGVIAVIAMTVAAIV